MSSENRCKHLADRIREILNAGIRLSPEVLHYIDSTYCNPSAPELNAIFADLDDSQTASLCALIFSPDEAMHLQLEGVLEKETWRSVDEETVVAFLLQRPIETEIYFPGKSFSLKLDMPRSAVERFVSHLNLTQNPDPRVVDAINRFLDGSLRTVIKVRLRQTRVALTENRIRFLCRLIEKAGTGLEDFSACFDLMLEIFGETADDGDIYRLLRDKKRFYFKGLQIAEKFTARLQQSNMETLILQGMRVPYIDSFHAR